MGRGGAQPGWGSFAWDLVGLLEFLDDLKHAIAARDRVVDQKFQGGSVLKNHRAPDQALDAFPVLGQHREAALLLFGRAQDADEDNRRMQIASDIDVIHRNQAGLADGKLAADNFADFPLEKFAHALESKRGHLL